eukprot:8015768-Lingulodinium_polyedra.AAC.1
MDPRPLPGPAGWGGRVVPGPWTALVLLLLGPAGRDWLERRARPAAIEVVVPAHQLEAEEP